MSTKTNTTDTATRKLPAFLEEEPKAAIEDTSRKKDDSTVKAEKPKTEKVEKETTADEPKVSLEEIRENQPERERFLDDASEIMADRQQGYGDPIENFTRIAQLWSVLFNRQVTVEEVALALDLVKTSRLIQSPTSRDGWVDKIGYSALGGELSSRHVD